jgi:hypothetical protein
MCMYEWFVCGRSQTFASASGGCVRSIHGHICICIYVYVYVRVCMNECACMHVLYVRMNSHLLTHICPHTYSFALEFIIEIHTHTNPQSLSHTHTCKPHTHMQTTHTHANHTHTCKHHTHTHIGSTSRACLPICATKRSSFCFETPLSRYSHTHTLCYACTHHIYTYTHIMLARITYPHAHTHVHTYYACTHHIHSCTDCLSNTHTQVPMLQNVSSRGLRVLADSFQPQVCVFVCVCLKSSPLWVYILESTATQSLSLTHTHTHTHTHSYSHNHTHTHTHTLTHTHTTHSSCPPATASTRQASPPSTCTSS